MVDMFTVWGDEAGFVGPRSLYTMSVIEFLIPKFLDRKAGCALQGYIASKEYDDS